jgi:ketosteroid isomerase-like protein
MASEPKSVVKAFYAALGRGDVSALVGLLDDDLEWTEAESFPYYGGTWTSAQAVVDNLLVPLGRDWDAFSATPREFLTDGPRVVGLGTYSGVYKRTGKSMSAPFAHLWTVVGTKITRFNMYTDTAKVLAATRVAA